MEDEMPKPRKKVRGTITDVRLIRMPRGDVSYPAIIFDGDMPKKGEKLTIKLDNGVTVTGKVYDATESAGEVLVEFTDGLTPTTKP